MTWSLAFSIRDNEISVTSKTTEVPDMNVTLNGHESDEALNVSTYVSTLKK